MDLNDADYIARSDRWLAEWANEEDTATDVDRHKYAYVYIGDLTNMSKY